MVSITIRNVNRIFRPYSWGPDIPDRPALVNLYTSTALLIESFEDSNHAVLDLGFLLINKDRHVHM